MQSVVVGTDGSPNAEAAVRRAADIAKCDGAVLHVVTAFSTDPTFGEGISSSAKRDRINLGDVADQLLARTERELESRGIQVMTHSHGGDPAKVLIDVANEENADLVVVGARGQTGLRRFQLGSVASKLAHHADTSVMIVREKSAA